MEVWILAALGPVASLVGVWIGARLTAQSAEAQQIRQREDQIFDHERREIASFTSTVYDVHYRLTSLVESETDTIEVLLAIKAGANEAELACQRLYSWASTDEARSVFPPVHVGLTVMDYFYLEVYQKRKEETPAYNLDGRAAEIITDYRALMGRCPRMLEFYSQDVNARLIALRAKRKRFSLRPINHQSGTVAKKRYS